MKKYVLIGKYLQPAQRKKRIIISLLIFVLSFVLQINIYLVTRIEASFSLCLIPFVIIAWFLGPWPLPILGIIQHAFTIIVIIHIKSIENFSQLIWLGAIMDIIIIGVSILVGISSTLRRKALIMAKQLEQAKEEKTRYFINLAHETKTPLTLISNYLNVYIQEKGMDPKLSIISTNIEKLKKNMINFLDYEKLERGQNFYDHGTYTDLTEIVASSTVLFKETAKQKHIKVTTDIEKNISIMADPYAIDCVIHNILDNAFKYTPERGRIDIRLKADNNTIEFTVKDTGIGIPADQLSNIFKSYYQISHVKRNIQGMGMGLNIVKRIIDDIGGRIEVTSTPGQGSEFKIIFNMPTEYKKQTLSVKPRARDYYMAKTVRQELPADVDLDPSKYTILLVEDNFDMLLYLRDELYESYNVYCAQNGKQALEKLSDLLDVHIVISDIMMDTMDGYEFYEEFKKDERYYHIPFIFLTARNTQIEKTKALQKGVVDFIFKPFDIEELKAKVYSIIKLSESQFEKSKQELVKNIIKVSKSSITEEVFLKEFYKICRQYNLSLREKETILLLLKGKQYKEISSEFHISENTVKTHVRHIYKKCGVQNKMELMNIFKFT